MIDFASKNDFKEIVNLWHISFGDSEATIERFLHTLFVENNCLVFREDSSIISMLFLLQADIVSASSTHPAYYVYAACTAPHSRGRGVMSKLLEYTIDFAAKENRDFLCLVPADEHLFEYYSRFGFKRIFKRKEFTLSRSIMSQLAENDAQTCKPSTNAIKLLRDKAISTGSRLLWDENIIKYAIEENELSGGKSIFVQKNGEFVGYSIYNIKSDTIIVKELCAWKGSFGLIVNILVNQTQADYFQFSLPLEFPFSADNLTIRDNGMILPLNAVGTTVLDTMFQAFIGFTLE